MIRNEAMDFSQKWTKIKIIKLNSRIVKDIDNEMENPNENFYPF